MRALLILSAMAGWGTAFATEAEQQRVPWTTSRIHGSPDPAKPFVASQIHAKLTFREATEIVFDVVSKRWIVLERAGKIFSFPHDGDAAGADLVADLKALHPQLDNLYGFAFHPKYTENHQVFISYTTGSGKDDGTKLSRFTLTSGATLQLDLASEKVILTWRSGGHNGASLQFGGDGMLYVSTGDSEVPSPPDPLNTGQDVSDLLSSILRIDVDRQDAGLAYAVPKDNPFVTTPKARPEVWAYGLRNPWKMSFDRATGRLWCGDVGWELWEMIHLIERGGNYGWSAMEASQPVRADAPQPPTPILPPVIAHSHDEAASITGGYVYHGKKFHELEGAYIYGDWETGKIWALWHDGKQVTRHEEIADTPHKIIAFGQDAKGELIYAHYGPQGTLHTLERNPEAGKANTFPRKLSETGLFGDNPKSWAGEMPGVHLFVVNATMWQRDARSTNFIALPGTSSIQAKAGTEKLKDGRQLRTCKLTWPKDAVLAKTLELKLQTGHARIETQVLHFDGEAWQAYTYRWDEKGEDAVLVSAQGDERPLVDANGEKFNWRFHSRAECMRCHNSWVGGALGFRPEQLVSPAATPEEGRSQLQKFAAMGLVDQVLATFEPEVRLARWEKGQSTPEFSARSYLHANCSPCHRQNAGGAVTMMLNAELPVDQMLAVGVAPLQGGLGLAEPKLIDPGNPWNSVICVRLAKAGAGHMPLVGQSGIHQEGLALLQDWIARMNQESDRAWVKEPAGGYSKAWVTETLGTVEGAMKVLHLLDDDRLEADLRQAALDLAWKSPLPTVRDLFERFKPEDQREVTIGLAPDVTKLLAVQGDAKRGSTVLSMQGKLATCYACHFINGAGRDFGPDLSKLGARLKREQILESLLQPGKVIAQGYTAITVEMKDGSAQAGFMVNEGAHDITVKTATGKSVLLMRGDIKAQTKLPASLMPEGQVQGLTAQEMADVLAYLESLR